jgi:hypothetical protein
MGDWFDLNYTSSSEHDALDDAPSIAPPPITPSPPVVPQPQPQQQHVVSHGPTRSHLAAAAPFPFEKTASADGGGGGVCPTPSGVAGAPDAVAVAWTPTEQPPGPPRGLPADPVHAAFSKSEGADTVAAESSKEPCRRRRPPASPSSPRAASSDGPPVEGCHGLPWGPHEPPLSPHASAASTEAAAAGAGASPLATDEAGVGEAIGAAFPEGVEGDDSASVGHGAGEEHVWAGGELRFATVADRDHPLHGAVVELVRPLPALRSALAVAVQLGAAETILPVHTSDVLDYMWPKLSSVRPEEWPTAAAVTAGTAQDLAVPRVMFTALAPLVDAVPAIRAFAAAHPIPAGGTALHVRLGAQGVRVRTASATELRQRALRVRATTETGGGAPRLVLTVDMRSQSAYFGSTRDALPQQLAANRWLALRTLCARLEGVPPPTAPRSACGAPSAYAFVEHEDADGLVQGAAFVMPLAREPGVRVGRPARVHGLVGRPELNGSVVAVLRSSGLGGRDDGWRAAAEGPAVAVDRWGARLPDGEHVRLKPANLEPMGDGRQHRVTAVVTHL